MTTTNDRFDEKFSIKDIDGPYIDINVDNVKTFIQQEKNLLLDQAIEEVDKLRVLHIHNSIPNFVDNLEEGCTVCSNNDGVAKYISKLKELKTNL